MPEFTTLTSSQTKYEITAEEFIRAAKGEPFEETEWFYRADKQQIERDRSLNTSGWDVKEHQEYIVVKEGTILLPHHSDKLLLHQLGVRTPVPTFIFLKSVLPPITVSRSVTGGWLFIQTQAPGVIDIKNDSEVGAISIRDNSQAGNVVISNNSHADDFNVSNDSVCGGLRVLQNSQVGYINIAEHSKMGSMAIEDSSQCNTIWISNGSETGAISIRRGAVANGISIKSNSRTGDITIGEDSQNDSIFVENSVVNGITVQENYCSIELANATIPLMRFTGCSIHRLDWKAGTKGELYIEGGQINLLNLYKTTLLPEANITLTNVRVYIWRLQELLVQGHLTCRSILPAEYPFMWEPAVKQFLIEHGAADHLNKLAALQHQEELYSGQVDELHYTYQNSTLPLLRIVDSSLGKTAIMGCDLTAFNMEYRDSNLLETFLSGTMAPKEELGIYLQIPANKEYHEQRVSIFHQLEKIYRNQGDLTQAGWYHALVQASQQHLQQEPEEDWWIKKVLNFLRGRK